MEETLAAIYQTLAEQLSCIIPVEWEKIYYHGAVKQAKESWTSVFYFVDQANTLVRSHSIPQRYHVSEEIYMQLLSELNRILLELYDCFLSNEQDPWTQVTFILSAEGHFEIQYAYDAYEEDPMKSETIWAYHTLGLLPQKGTTARDFLDTYLESRCDKTAQ